MPNSDRQGFQTITEGYKIHDIDDTADPKYYGFVSHDQFWYVMQENVAGKTFRYCRGQGDYPTNWGNRATTLVYKYWYEV